MTEHQQDAEWNVAEWHGKMLVDRDGEKIGKLQDVYVDVENDEPQVATVKEGIIGRHLTFVLRGGIKVGPDELQVAVTREQIKAAPNIEQHGEELCQADESRLYHHYELNYIPPDTESRAPTRSPLRPTATPDNSEFISRICGMLVVRPVSPALLAFRATVVGQKGREAVGHGHADKGVSRY